MPNRQISPTRTAHFRTKRRNHRRPHHMSKMLTLVPHQRRNPRNAPRRTAKRKRRPPLPQKMETKNPPKNTFRRKTLQPDKKPDTNLKHYFNFTILPVAEDFKADSAILSARNPSNPVIKGFSFPATQLAKCRNSSFKGS